MTDRGRKNLSCSQSEHPDVLANLARLLNRGRSVRHRTHVEDLHGGFLWRGSSVLHHGKHND